MAFQSQTYSNSNNAYYITNQIPVVPTDPTAIQTPLELLGLGGSSAAYYARILQTDANGLAIIEASTIQGPLMGITLNPNGTNGPVANAGPQIYAGFSSSQPNILLTSSLTEVFGTLAIGTRLDQTDVNALKIGYSATPYPNSLITQTSGGSNQLQVSLQAPLIGAPAVVIANPANATQTTTINGNKITVKDTGFQQPSASLSFIGGQAAVTATTGLAQTQILTDSGGGSALEATNSLTLLVGYDTITPRNVLVGNTDGTTNIPLKMYGPEVSTITSNSFIENTSTFITKTAGTGFLSVGDSGISDYSRNAPFNTGKLTWNTIKTTKGAPATASNSLEINNTAPDSTTGGIQFYCGNNTDLPNPKWMGGFQQSSTGPTSEFRLASTVQASMSQITNLSTINNIALRDFGVPTGSMMMWCPFVPTPPAGYLICDGGQFNSTDPRYAALYAVIGQTYSNGTAIFPNFRVPNMLGKAAYGSMSVQDNVTPTNERTNVYVTAVITVNTPTGSTQALYCTGSDGPLYKGMQSEVIGRTMRILTILYDQTSIYNFVLIPDPAFTINLTGTGTTDFFFLNGLSAGSAPYIGNNAYSFSVAPGNGTSYYGMRTDEIAPHIHDYNLGNGTAYSVGGAPDLIAADNSRQTSNNKNIYSYTPPGGSNQAAAAGIRYIPPNTATWFIIKL